MKTIFRIALAAAVVATMAGCKAFRTMTDSRLKTAQGAPYELIVVCPQQEWTGEVGDTLRAIFPAQIPYLNQTEPLFDVLRVTERGFTGMVADHRNILKAVSYTHLDVYKRQALRGFLADFASLPGAKILVHGGGKLATRLAQKLELQVQMVDGRRITCLLYTSRCV